MNNVIFKIATTQEELEQVKKMRYEIFTTEQGIRAELDNDGDDERSIHLLATNNLTNEPMASGRLTINFDKGVLSRIAVNQSFRGLKLGQQVVKQLERIAREKKVIELSLSPHSYLEKFYSDLGFKTEAGEKHVGKYTLLTMTKSLI